MRNSFFFRKVYTMSGKFWDGSWLGLAHLHTFTGWWFGTFFVVPSYMVIIIPTDELIFFRGVGWNYQPDVHLPMIDVPWPSSRHPWPSSRHGFSPCQGLGHGVSPGMWIAGCPRMWGVRGETPAVSSGLATQPCLIRKMVVLTGYFYGFGAWILGRFRDNTRWESHGRCAEGRFETHWLWVHYGNMVRIFGKILPKELSVLGMLLIFADGWSHHSRVFGLLGWKRGSDMSWHRFMHLKILKSLRKTLWNIMEHSKHLENYKWLGAFELGNWSSPGKGMSWSLILTRHDSLSENWRVSIEKRDIGDWHVFWLGNLIIGWLL